MWFFTPLEPTLFFLKTGLADGKLVYFPSNERGIGIAQANQTRIFELFKRLHMNKHYSESGIGFGHL